MRLLSAQPIWWRWVAIGEEGFKRRDNGGCNKLFRDVECFPRQRAARGIRIRAWALVSKDRVGSACRDCTTSLWRSERPQPTARCRRGASGAGGAGGTSGDGSRPG